MPLAKKGKSCYDVPSAFVNTDMDEDIIMVLKGDMADMMMQMALEVYQKYVAVDMKGTKVLYVMLQKALWANVSNSALIGS